MAGRIQSEFVGDYVPSHEPYNIFAESYVDGKNTAVDRPTVLASRTKILCQSILPEIEILDSEDEEIQSALLEPMQHQEPRTISDDSTEPSVADVLHEFRNRYIKDYHTNCVITRSKPLNGAIRLLEKTTVKLQNKLFVKFSEEIGEDHGGPRREFFRLAIAELGGSKFFEGPDGAKVFRHDLQLVEKGQYRIVGRLLAMSLAQDGPGFHWLNKQLFAMMTGREGETTAADEITDPNIKECLEMSTNKFSDKHLSQCVKYMTAL
ncbi:uncharacterized protein LOC127846217 [Dreissena polymorpha]|uniref:uncharacterized protein LOC127846217 n=1 Tax=Dreissena polymorpha TaxID=45954 RepID=UPI00226475A7|nr:uncharacterized protein LOC127846217 [Dreissena polymorpha]